MNKILSTINGMFFPKQVMMIFNRSIGISISLKSRILSYYFQIQNFILKTLPDVKYEKSSHSIIYFNVNPCSHRFSRPIFISFLYNLHSPPTFLHSKLKGSNTNWIAKSKSSTGNIPVKRKLSQYLLHNTVIPYTSWSFLITSFNGMQTDVSNINNQVSILYDRLNNCSVKYENKHFYATFDEGGADPVTKKLDFAE